MAGIFCLTTIADMVLTSQAGQINRHAAGRFSGSSTADQASQLSQRLFRVTVFAQLEMGE
jgi:hypothetical protein